MFSQAFLGIRRFFEIADFYNCLFLTVDRKNNVLIPIDKRRQIKTYFWIAFHAFHLLCQMISIKTKSSDLVLTVGGMTLSGAYLLACLWLVDIKQDSTPGQLMNYIAAREDKNIPGKVMISTCLAILVHLIYLACWLVPISVATLSLLWPCFPSLLSSLLCSTESRGWTGLWLLIQVALAIVEFVGYQTVSVSAAHYGISTTGTGIASLWLYCKELEITEHAKKLRSYRNLKILEKIVNACIRNRIFLAIALGGPLVQVLVGYTIIQIANSPNVTILAGSSVIYVSIFATTMFYFSIAAQVYRMSKDWIKRQLRVLQKKEGRRLQSLMSIRIEFGNNFVETLTPLVVQGFCINETVSLLLLNK
ncbi:hypothetical protein Fcan01_17223 [Folsomia candida]|uniref:Gustatory receptor n=1 Tax=Folsomia candida TaxID=158441 RepID=A0A226DS35_FOLCA|nr:hypothetical protein Fcan01_17223 [Folsomia candida]